LTRDRQCSLVVNYLNGASKNDQIEPN